VVEEEEAKQEDDGQDKGIGGKVSKPESKLA
jgi:hypothetical protein